jgi:hypothetical protein
VSIYMPSREKSSTTKPNAEINQRLRKVDSVLDGLVLLGPKLGIPSILQLNRVGARTRRGPNTLGYNKKITSFSPWIVMEDDADGEPTMGCIQKEIKSLVTASKPEITKSRKMMTVKATPETIEGINTPPMSAFSGKLMHGAVALEVPSSDKVWIPELGLGPISGIRFMIRTLDYVAAYSMTADCENLAKSMDTAARNLDLNPVLALELQAQDITSEA